MTGTASPDQLLAANEDAAEFYRRHLLGPGGDGPRRYLTQRGFAALLDDTPWTIGHAPPGWTALHDHLSELGYSDDVQLAAGLTSTSRRGTLIDRFRDRLTFGIRDQQDRLVGFTARTGPEGRDPKYLNTPRTDLFDKSQVPSAWARQHAHLPARASSSKDPSTRSPCISPTSPPTRPWRCAEQRSRRSTLR